MLSKYFDSDDINIISKKDFKLYPKASDREFWNNISDSLKNQLVQAGDKYYKYRFPALYASDYMDFERKGDRTAIEIHFRERRTALNSLVLAECAEYKGRFTDDIINAVYLICDETSWVIPAHNYKDIRFGTHDGNNTAILPRDDNIVIDLFSSHTAHCLSLAYYLLKDELDRISPLICQRIERRIEERMTSLYEKYDEYFWKTETNNWNPNCNYPCAAAAAIMIDDDDRRRAFFKKLIKSINVYLNSYRDDGGCDEGVVYWNESCAKLYRALNLLKYISHGKIDVTHEQKMINMAAFPVNMYIGNGRFINHADCLSYAMPDIDVMYNFGKDVNNDSLIGLSKIAKESNYICKSIDDVIVFDKIDKEDAHILLDKEYFYPDLQVAVLREDNVVFAAKGGHNNESHNHCDVGSFMLYKNNNPVIADPGTDQYISTSFTPQRYTIWYNNSLHHNVPSVNGLMQKNGPRYEGKVMSSQMLYAPMYGASDVSYENDRFSLDISGAYGDENIKYWKREFYFDRKNNTITVTEDYELLQESEIELVFMVAGEPAVSKDCIKLSEGVTLMIDNLDVGVCEITDMNYKMKKQWGSLFRLSLSKKDTVGKIQYSLNW